MTIAVYLRVSKEGGDSIANQRKLILDYIRRMPEWDGARIQEFCDDGYSGRNFERPAAARMLQDYDTLNCLLEDYYKKKYVVSRIFCLMKD